MISKQVTLQMLYVLRAILELDREAYGLEIAKRSTLQRSTCYMILKRLVNNGCLTTRWDRTDTGGPPRKYYALVPARRPEVVELLVQRGIEVTR